MYYFKVMNLNMNNILQVSSTSRLLTCNLLQVDDSESTLLIRVWYKYFSLQRIMIYLCDRLIMN